MKTKNVIGIMDRISKYYEQYRDGIINDIDFVGSTYDLCKEYLEEEAKSSTERVEHIEEFLY